MKRTHIYQFVNNHPYRDREKTKQRREVADSIGDCMSKSYFGGLLFGSMSCIICLVILSVLVPMCSIALYNTFMPHFQNVIFFHSILKSALYDSDFCDNSCLSSNMFYLLVSLHVLLPLCSIQFQCQHQYFTTAHPESRCPPVKFH